MGHRHILLCFSAFTIALSNGCQVDTQADEDEQDAAADPSAEVDGGDAGVIGLVEATVELAPDLHYGTPDAGSDDDAIVIEQPVVVPEPACEASLCESGAELPGDQRLDAAGSCARVVAAGQGAPQDLEFAPNGFLFAIDSSGQVSRYFDWNCDGSFDAGTREQLAWAESGGHGDDLAFDVHYSYLYATSPDGVVRWLYCGDTFGGGAALPVVVGQPTGQGHSELQLDESWLYVKSTDELATVIVKRFALAELDFHKPFSWPDGEVLAGDAAAAVFDDRASAHPDWSWRRGAAADSSPVEVVSSAVSPLDHAYYVAIASSGDASDSAASIYRIAAEAL